MCTHCNLFPVIVIIYSLQPLLCYSDNLFRFNSNSPGIRNRRTVLSTPEIGHTQYGRSEKSLGVHKWGLIGCASTEVLGTSDFTLTVTLREKGHNAQPTIQTNPLPCLCKFPNFTYFQSFKNFRLCATNYTKDLKHYG